ncbi:MAG: hypothetical protein NUV73_01630 [Candidatus Daviesbacteria bacterium]|nr:hypothetical protein [Candidatus Daviesbacteria bacterium]
MNSKKVLGGMGFLDEGDFERETSSPISAVAEGVGGVFKDILNFVSEDLAGIESKESGKFSTTGSIEFNGPKEDKINTEQMQKMQKENTETNRKRAFVQALKEDIERAARAKDKLLFEEEINDIITNLPTEQKNQLLHYQASYKDRSIYQRAELRKKLIEQKKKTEKQEKAASIPSPAKQPSAMEGAFEGRSGTQGSGSANLSNQAVG